MKQYIGLFLVVIGVVALLAVWLMGIARVNNLLLLIPFFFIIGGTVAHVLFLKHSSRY
jgi:hypothetical protein